MKNVFLKSLFAIACLLGSINASAYDFEVDGIYYNVVSLDELTCKVVSGNTRYKGDVVIPATVSYGNRTLTVIQIAKDAFDYENDMTGLTIPNTISSISNVSFYKGGSKLESVTIEDGETELTINGVFREIPVKTLYMGRNLLNNYEVLSFNSYSLKEVTIGNSVTEISKEIFYKCQNLKNVTIGNSVTKIGSNAFSGCSGLTNVTIPNSVTEIGSSAFSGCSGLTNVTIPNSVTEIGNSAFSGCI